MKEGSRSRTGFEPRNPKAQLSVPVIALEDVHEAMVQSCSAAGGSPALVELKGEGSQGITLALNRVSVSTQEVVFAGGASEEAVVKRISIPYHS